MKKYLLILGLSFLIAGIYSSCKKDPLEALRNDEVSLLNAFVIDNNLASYKDSTGIYFKKLIENTDANAKQVGSGYKTEIYFTVTLINKDTVLLNMDKYGHNYEPFTFYVDVSNTTVNSSYIQQIAGIHAGIKKMKVGETAFMVIPSELAFKAMDYSVEIGIPRFSTLLATVTVVSALSPKEQNDY